MENKEPSFTLNIQAEDGLLEHESNPRNSALYRHMGELAIYDHAYCEVPGGCTRIWRHNEHYLQVEKFMLENAFPVHVNLRKVQQSDVEAYDEMVSRQMGDINQIPDAWNDQKWGENES